MLNWVLSLMVIKKQLTLEEAEYLSKELASKIHPQDFLSAHRIVEDVLAKLKK